MPRKVECRVQTEGFFKYAVLSSNVEIGIFAIGLFVVMYPKVMSFVS